MCRSPRMFFRKNKLARFSYPRRIWFGSLALIGLVLFVAFYASLYSNWTPENYKETVRRGNAVVTALDAYHSKHKAYPRVLEELIPVYLKEIPPPVVGNGRWQYKLEHINSGFHLMVGEHPDENDPQTDPVMWYSLRDKAWPVDTR